MTARTNVESGLSVCMAVPRNTTVLVTGHSGYIGSVVVDKLARRGYRVRGLDTGYFCGGEIVPPVRSHEELTKDIRSVSAEDMEGVAAIVHLAALSNDALGEFNPQLTMEINVRASEALARLARQAGIGRFICASSCSIYGVDGGRAASEDSVLKPQTPYAESKVLMEQAISVLADASFAPVFLRCGTAYGFSPRMRFDLVLNNLMGWAMATGEIRIVSDGTPWRPMVHVEDIADAIAAALEAPHDRVWNQALNVGDDCANHRIVEIAEVVRETVPGTRVVIESKADRDLRSYRVDFSRLRQVLPEFRPKWTLQAGTAALYERLCENDFSAARFSDRRFVRFKQLRHLLSTGALDPNLRWSRDSGSSG
jgi:nucleoside-diphosphate-sugar epimerase